MIEVELAPHLGHQETVARNKAIIARSAELLGSNKPMTVRHLFYLLISGGLIENSPKEYNNLIKLMVRARMNGDVDFESLVDGTRNSIRWNSWSGLGDFTESVRHQYRKDLWQQQADYIEFWFEKDAIVGVLYDTAYEYDVTMRPLRGQPSVSFIHQAAKQLSEITKPIHIYYLGDHDPAGYEIEITAKNRLMELLGRCEASSTSFTWTRLAFTPADFDRYDVALMTGKKKDANYNKFVERFGDDRAAELDAIPPDALRTIFRETVESHIDQRAWQRLKKTERLERESFNEVMSKFGKKVAR